MPNALKFTSEELLDLRTRPTFADSRKLIVIDASGSDVARHVAADLRAGGASVAVLAGGAAAWQAQVLDPSVTDALAKAWQLRMQGKSALGEGAAPPPAPKKKKVKRKKRKEGGCS
jgi:rhodanese-related sulfurtransferase